MTKTTHAPELVAAYRKARESARYYGSPYASAPYDPRHAGPLKAAEALTLARERLAAHEAAQLRYSEAVAAREAAPELAELKQAEEAARKAASRAAGLVTYYGPRGQYGPGTWQGAEEAPAHARKPCGSGYMASAMHGGRSGGLFFLHGDGGDVLRNVADAGDVIRLDHTGYYDNAHGESFRDGSGLCVGVVAQLRGRGGRAGYVPGYRFGGCEDSGTFDMASIHWADGSEEWQAEEAQQAAAREADGMAERAAEQAREYDSAWQAGRLWAEAGERLAELRAELRAALAERRTQKAEAAPVLCRLIREAIDSKLAERAELIRERAELADGDGPFPFWPGDSKLAAAFCEGAELDAMPGGAA